MKKRINEQMNNCARRQNKEHQRLNDKLTLLKLICENIKNYNDLKAIFLSNFADLKAIFLSNFAVLKAIFLSNFEKLFEGTAPTKVSGTVTFALHVPIDLLVIAGVHTCLGRRTTDWLHTFSGIDLQTSIVSSQHSSLVTY